MNDEYGMQYTYLIPSTLYGPNYELNDRHFIFDLIRKIVDAKQNGGEVVLWGDGYLRRELIYIDDAVKIIVISFHSIEDRVVKLALKDEEKWLNLHKRPLTPGEQELAENPRSRSAKLRIATKNEPSL